MRRIAMLLACSLAALAASAPALAGGPKMLLGAAEDAVRKPTLPATKAQFDLLRLAGFDAVRITETWAPGQTAPVGQDRQILENVGQAAALSGVRLVVTIMNAGSRTTPLPDLLQAEFSQFAAATARLLPSARHFVVGNEPNLNRYWLPQFGPNGEDVAAVGYESLLAKTYDALKAVSPKLVVLGGAVSPRGGDRPGTGRDTHSPTAFITDIGAAYRASGRTTPIMDALAIHPYEDNSSVAPFDGKHPNSTSIAIADYDKLVALLGTAFDGTAQPGSTLPIYYTEFGVEAQIPAEKAPLYTGVEPATVKPVPESVQADYYRQAITLAFCQPNVRGLFVFHTVDETDLNRWQSGLYYADDTPKSTLPAVRTALRDARRGVIAQCTGMALRPAPRVQLPARVEPVTLTCDIDCTYQLRLERLPSHATVTGRSGRAVGGTPTRLVLPRRHLVPGSYRFTLRLTAPVNPGPPRLLSGPSFRLPSRPG